MTIPYDQVDNFSYEYTKKHRVAKGAAAMVASIGAGTIVMMTKEKSHWLYIDFHDQNVPKTLILCMEKNDYKNILASIKTHTGKDVEFLGKGKTKNQKNGS